MEGVRLFSPFGTLGNPSSLRDCRVILPARNVAETINEGIKYLRSLGLRPEQIIIVVNDSTDGTYALVRRKRSVTGLDLDRLIDQTYQRQMVGLEDWGLSRERLNGKGMALYGGMLHLQMTEPDLPDDTPIVFLDADLAGYGRLDAVRRLLWALETPPPDGTQGPKLAKFIADPRMDNQIQPFLGAHPIYSDLAAINWPLCGQVALPWGMLKRLHFATGYSVEMAVMMGVWDWIGNLSAFVDVEVPEGYAADWDYHTTSESMRHRTLMVWKICHLLYSCAEYPLRKMHPGQIRQRNSVREGRYWRWEYRGSKPETVPLDAILPSINELIGT